MAASEEFPRGWTAASRAATGVQLLLTLPASFGTCHVLTGIAASMVNNAIASADVVLEVTDGALITFTLATNNPLVEMAINASAINNQVTASWSGKIIGGVGNALTVRFNAGVPNFVEQLSISWYDI